MTLRMLTMFMFSDDVGVPLEKTVIWDRREAQMELERRIADGSLPAFAQVIELEASVVDVLHPVVH